MASMKLCKPSYGYASKQINFSEYHHQEEYQVQQSTHAEPKWASKPIAQGCGALDVGGLGLANSAKSSTRYQAQAHSVLPSPSVHVQQANYGMGSMKRQESHMGQDWGSNTNMLSGLAQTDNLGLANKPYPQGSPVRGSQYGSTFKEQKEQSYNYNKNTVEGGWASEPANCPSPTPFNHAAQGMYKQQEQRGWADKPNKYVGGVGMNNSGLAMHSEDYTMGKMDQGYVGSQGANYSSLHNEEHMMGKVDQGWVSSPTRANYSSQAMRKDQHTMGKVDQGWVSSPTQANYSNLAMHKDQNKMGKVDQGWVSSPTQANYSNLSMHKEQHMMGQMDHALVNSPSRKSSSNFAMHKGEHMMGSMDHMPIKPTQCSSPSRANQYGQSMFKAQEEKVYNFSDRGMESGWAGNTGMNQSTNSGYGWAGKSVNSMGSAQVSHSAHAAYDHHEYGHENVNDIMDEILTKYPAHNVGGGPTGAYGGRNQGSYAKQAWGGAAHHGRVHNGYGSDNEL